MSKSNVQFITSTTDLSSQITVQHQGIKGLRRDSDHWKMLKMYITR